MQSEIASLGALTDDLHMLCSTAVAYGNSKDFQTFHTGNQSEIVWTEQGFADQIVPISDNSIYDLASLTKLFTLISLLMLLEAKQLKMTDCVGRIDNRFHYLQDTSIYDVITYQALLKSPARIDRQASVEEGEKQVFSTYQSTAYQERIYSDMNALILQYVIEKASGLSLISFLQRQILTPLGMSNTWAKVPRSRLADCVNYNYEHSIVNGHHAVRCDVPPGTPHDPKARLLSNGRHHVCGHAGLFSTMADMVAFAQGLLNGKLILSSTLSSIGKNRTGYLKHESQYRQFMGLLCFSKSAVPRLSEVPLWMGQNAFALSGYTGNHIAIDPDLGVFDILLGNRCHNRVSLIQPPEEVDARVLDENGAGRIQWPDGRKVYSSFKYVYLKDKLIHNPVYERLLANRWLCGGRKVYAKSSIW